MNKAIILHGKPSRERYEDPELPKPHEANWLPWIQGKLGKIGVKAFLPALPQPYHPVYEDWREAVEPYEINNQTALIGFSAGAEFALRWLSERKDANPERVVLVAPWRDSKSKYGDFSNYTLDPNLGKRIGRITIFSSLDDGAGIQENARRLATELPQSELVQLDGYGHFMLGNNMTTPDFPELLEELSRPVH